MTDLDTATVPYLRTTEFRCVPASGDIREDFADAQPRPRRGIHGLARVVGGAVIVFVSAVNSVPLPPPHDRRRETSSVIGFLVAARGRRISMVEARNLALAAMAQAEQRRAAFAVLEAKLLTIWEEGV